MRWHLAAWYLVLGTVSSAAWSQAAPVAFSFTHGGFSEGASASGTFAGQDLNANGQLSSFDGEVTGFSFSFSGNTTVTAFSLALPNLTGLVYDLDGGPLGDGTGGAIEGIDANDANFQYAIGPGPVALCDGINNCAFVSSVAPSGTDNSKSLAIVGGSQSSAPSTETAVAVLTQTASIQPGIVSQRVGAQIQRVQARRGGGGPGGGRPGGGAQGAASPSASSGATGATFVARGLAAGDATPGNIPISFWWSFLRTEIENDGAATPFDSDVFSVIGGVDTFVDDFVVGVSVGYESQITSSRTPISRQEGQNFSLIPYAGYLINDWASVDISAGYTRVDVDQSRVQGATRFLSDVGSNRMFAAANVNLSHAEGDWYFTGSAGWLYVRERQHAFRETAAGNPAVVVNNAGRTVRLGQLRIGGGAAYYYRDWEPFVSAHYVHDYTRTRSTVAGASNDDDEFRVGGGVRYYDDASGLSTSLEYTGVLGRQDIRSDSVSFTLRLDL